METRGGDDGVAAIRTYERVSLRIVGNRGVTLLKPPSYDITHG